MNGAVSVQEVLQGSETETRKLLGGTEERSLSLTKGSLICTPGNSIMNLMKSKLIKIKSVAKNLMLSLRSGRRRQHLHNLTFSASKNGASKIKSIARDDSFVRTANKKTSKFFQRRRYSYFVRTYVVQTPGFETRHFENM